MSLISIREYEKLFIGEFDPLRPSVTAQQAELLTNLKSVYGFEVFKYVNRHAISAQQYVGVYQLGSHAIEVLPKVDGNSHTVRRNLIAMLSLALDLDIGEGDMAHVASQEHGILEILIKLFCDKLFFQVRQGLIRRYERREENLTVLRGRLGVAEQIRLNGANPERLFCRYDEFQEDNPLNQVLKAAIRLLLGRARTAQNQSRLSQLLLVFESVSDCPKMRLPWERVVFDRLSMRYHASFKLAKLFLENSPPDVTGGRTQGFSLFFDMNVLFEEYIGRRVRQVFGPDGFRVVLQGPQRHLAFNAEKKSPAFAMKPDIVLAKSEHIRMILDTKWKSLTMDEPQDGVAQSDLYQMYAYAHCYSCRDVVLLYPHHSDLGETAGVRSSYWLNPWPDEVNGGQRRRIRVATVDLSDLNTVGKQLKSLFGAEVETRKPDIGGLHLVKASEENCAA